jgi:hypothetical protein
VADPEQHAKITEMATLKERIDRHDREIAAIRKLVLTGMKMFVKLEEQQVTLKEEHIVFVRSCASSRRSSAQRLGNWKPSSGHCGVAPTAIPSGDSTFNKTFNNLEPAV